MGASLQAYALVKYLTDLGHEVEIIDYRPEYLRGHYRLDAINNPRYDRLLVRQLYLLAKLPGRLKAKLSQRKKRFDEFEKRYLPLTKECYHSNEELKKNPPIADVYLAGSDQIWNTLFQNGRDSSFYLEFAPKESVKASYAASFATEDILKEWKKPIKGWLQHLDYISVRESSGIDIVKNLGIHEVKQVMDPVFLLDKKSWENLASGHEKEEAYLFLYDFDRNEDMNKYAQRIAKKKKLQIYSMYNSPVADRCYTQAGPLEFLRLVYEAEYVISNSFHATAFAIIFEKPFAVFERKDKINTRLLDLLGLFDLCKINECLDYDDINSILKKKIDESQKYLDEVLSVYKDS